MENEQTVVVDFDGANRIYLAGVLDEACAELPELPRLPVPSLNGDDPAVASLLHLMGQRDEMASASGALVCELGALKDTAKAAHARLADAQERVARAREALLRRYRLPQLLGWMNVPDMLTLSGGLTCLPSLSS